MARASGTRFAFEAAALPALPGALEVAAAGVETGGAAHNRRFVAASLDGRGRASRPELVTLAHDPQTSGGLLAAIAPDRVADVDGRARRRRRRALVGRRRRGTTRPAAGASRSARRSGGSSLAATTDDRQ